MMVEAMRHYGPDSFPGTLVSIMQGSTETTFYVLALYFGSVGITKTKYAVACGLLADLVGVLAAILLCYFFFSERALYVLP
jgi:spore maturation protein SpmB